MGTPLSVLIVEDSASDAALMVRRLQKDGFEVVHERVETVEQMRAALAARAWDAVLSDFKVPGFGAMPALALLQESGLDLPFVLVSGTIGEAAAVEMMKTGAHDYVMKDHMARLGAVLKREIKEAGGRAARRRAEIALRESEDRNRDLVESSHDLICTHDLEGRLLTVNAAAVRLTGYSQDALLRMNLSDQLSRGAKARFAAYLAEIRTQGQARGLLKIRNAQGEARWLEYDNTLRTEGVATPVVRGVARDITAEKKAQDELRESEERFRSLTEMSSDFYWETDAEHRLTQRISPNGKSSAIAMFNSGAQIGKRRWELHNLAPDAAGWAAHRATLDARQRFRDFELSRLGADGSERFISISGDPVFDAAGVFKGYRGVGSDITERKLAAKALEDREAYLTAIIENQPGLIWLKDTEGRFLAINHAFAASCGRKLEDVLNRTDLDIWPRNLAEKYRADDARVMQAGQPTVVEELIDDQHQAKWFETFKAPIKDRAGRIIGTTGFARDITERKRAGAALRESEERFRGLVEQSLVGIFITDGIRLRYCNPRTEEIAGYQPGELAGAPLQPLIVDADYPAIADALRRLMTGGAQHARLDFRARRKDGGEVVIGAQGVRSRLENEPVVIGVLQDISEKKRAEDEIKRYVAELENAFRGTVAVTMNLSEMHDPYTSGHERRVAKIATALGAELGLDERQQEGLRVAGQLHDLGKIVIPAEILSKPGKLSPIEYQLVQGHSQASYDVLKNVRFPWPVAEIALQHHERMDGSGYPQGLKGEAILLEARIMAVADVVEAMATHRPYRSALGMDQALAEIESGRGSVYDADVADACLRLFREKGYVIPT